MKSLLERLAQGEILISDGAMGTMLQAKGFQPGECPESWGVTHPEVIREIALAYVAAGSDIIETNTFGGNAFKLSNYGMAEKVVEFNRAAAALARDAAGGKAYVAASVGPTGHIVAEEGGDASPEDLYGAFREQVVALAEGGVDVFCIETMLSLTEAIQAIRAAKENTRLPVMCTFTFGESSRGFRTMMGVTPERAARETAAAGADVIGTNCGNGIAKMIEIAREMRAALPTTPILIQANAGLPVLEGDKTVFKETPDYMASRVQELIEAGANIVGGCCGTTPAHIAAMAQAVRAK